MLQRKGDAPNTTPVEDELKQVHNFSLFLCMVIYSTAELVHGEKEHSVWFPKLSILCSPVSGT